MMSDVDKIDEFKQAIHKSNVQLGIKQISNAIVLPGKSIGGGIISGNAYFEESAMHINHAYAHPYNYNENEVINDDSDALYVGMLDPVWGHCITDNLKNMWVFFNNIHLDLTGIKIIYTTNNSAIKLPNSFIDLLKSIGIDLESFTCIKSITRFRKIYLPDSCFFCDKSTDVRHYTREYVDIIERITEKYCHGSHFEQSEKLYFSREHWKSPKDFGEKYVRQAFEDSGYKIIYPETLSLGEQISLIYNCSTLATTDGSIAHNALFMRSGSELVIIRKAPYLNGYQGAINEIKDLNVIMIDANKSNMLINKNRQWSGPFFLYANKKLCDFLNIQKPVFPFIGYAKYCGVSLVRRFKILIERIIRINYCKE